MMKRIWAPWRIQYILNKTSGSCFLCVRKTRGYQKRHLILCENNTAFVLLNRYPYSAGHIMVVAKRHVADLEGFSGQETADFFQLVRFACRALRGALHPDGLNMGANLGAAAGAGAADHFHFHIVARWNGDHNFMPVVGSTTVMSEYLDETYARLLPFFQQTRPTGKP